MGGMPKRRTHTRAAATRAALAAKTAYDTRQAARDAEITDALTAFYTATAEATETRVHADQSVEAVLAAARDRAADIRADADQRLREHDTTTRTAIARLASLGLRAADIAELCQTGVPAIRAHLAAARQDATPTAPGAAASQNGPWPPDDAPEGPTDSDPGRGGPGQTWEPPGLPAEPTVTP